MNRRARPAITTGLRALLWLPLAATADPAPALAAIANPPPPPSHRLTHGAFVVEVMDPHAPDRYNRGVRFTPVAAILGATLGPHPFLYREAEQDPLTAVAGLFAEFDLRRAPPGFAEAPIGEGHLKIGVGVLAKDAADYNFWRQHRVIQLAQTTVTWGPDTAVFRQVCAPCRGYAYALDATITVGDGTITVDWRLTNTGSKPFETEQYVHNCFQFDGHTVGPGVAVRFPYAVRADALQPEQRLNGRTIEFLAAIRRGLDIAVDYPADYAGPNTVAVEHRGSGLSVTCSTSRPGRRTVVHAASYYVCPEQFMALDLQPGACVSWQRGYVFAAARPW